METKTRKELQRANYEIAEAIAPTWERRRADVEAFAAPVRAWMLQELAPRTGDTILELAAGNGDTGFEAVPMIGARGKLITTDFSPAMVASARRRGYQLGLANVDYRVIDAQDIDLADDSVDGVLCRFGLMLMVDPEAALAEIRRVLRPAGRLVLAVWGPPQHNPYFTAVVSALVTEGRLAPPDPEGPGVFRMADGARTIAWLTKAGFETVRTEEVSVLFRLASIDAYLDFVGDTAGPIGLSVRRLTDEERGAVAAQVADVLGPFATRDGVDIPGDALCAVAR